jgi:hypothetical protein
MSLISEFCSRRSPVMSKSREVWEGSGAEVPDSFALPPALPGVLALPLRVGGIGMNDSLGRRPTRISPVGPFGPRAK